jgi:diapolycopene oxygenase
MNPVARGASGGRNPAKGAAMISSNPERTRVVVVGGGLGGLASAVELAGRGAAVTIVESNTHLGGKMNVLEEAGFTFDMGPTILTLPEVISGIIRRAGKRVEDYIDLIRLDPQWRCAFEDGTVIDLLEDVDAMAAHLDGLFPGRRAGEGYRAFIEYSRRMNRLSRNVFFYRDVGGVGDVMRGTKLGDSEVMGDALAMRLHSTVGKTAQKHVKEPHVLQVLEHFLQYVGSSPFLAPAILSMIASAQVDQGCWYPMGGTRMVARALARLAEEMGVETVLGQRVAKIEQANGRVSGVTLFDGRTIDADAVVSNCDVQRTLKDLVGTPAAIAEAGKVARKYTPACSGIVLYLGLDRQYEQLAHHNFLFSAVSADEFDDIYQKGIPARDPTMYIAAPSRTDPDQAPEGGEALYILVHTPYIRPGSVQSDRERFIREYRPVIIEKLKRMGMPDIEDHIVVERHLTPTGIEKMYNAEGGAIYGLASHGKLGGGFKPKNSTRVVGGLYFAGGSVNPGPGMPMVLMSGVTAADTLAGDMGLPGQDIPATSAEPGPGEYRHQRDVVPAAAGGGEAGPAWAAP